MPLYTTHMWANVRNEDCTRLIGFLAQLFIACFSLLLMLLLVSYPKLGKSSRSLSSGNFSKSSKFVNFVRTNRVTNILQTHVFKSRFFEWNKCFGKVKPVVVTTVFVSLLKRGRIKA